MHLFFASPFMIPLMCVCFLEKNIIVKYIRKRKDFAIRKIET